MNILENQPNIEELFKKYLDNRCTADEIRQLMIHFENEMEESPLRSVIRAELSSEKQNEAGQNDVDNAVSKVRSALIKQIRGKSGRERSLFSLIARWYNIAAAVLIFVSIAAFFVWRRSAQQQMIARHQQNNIVPGSNKAILILGNGREIVLTTAKKGKIITEGSSTINKTADGEVLYQPLNNQGAAISYNILKAPRGGQYQVVLSDGSHIWLNAASSLKYPTSFTGKERVVELTGEAYFEVAHDAARPFKVKSNGQTVEVLGTHFDINAYNDEPTIVTTLLEGSVKVAKGNNSALLVPGQEADLNTASGRLTVHQANLEKTIAWTKGEFVFERDNIEPIMRQISRWYDVDVSYQGGAPHQSLVGSVSRFDQVSDVLKTLELTGTVHFKVEGRRIIVMK